MCTRVLALYRFLLLLHDDRTLEGSTSPKTLHVRMRAVHCMIVNVDARSPGFQLMQAQRDRCLHNALL